MNGDNPKFAGFYKWLSSSKFQLAILFLTFDVFLVLAFALTPAVAISTFKDVCIGYFAARVLEPVAEFLTKKNGTPDKRGE